MLIQNKTLALFMAAATLPLTTPADVLINISPGTGAPPGTLGGYSVAPFPVDLRAGGATVTDAPGPAGYGPVTFSQDVILHHVGQLDTTGFATDLVGWDTWSHGYQGAVYQTEDSELFMTLPTGTSAFYMYVQPNRKYTFEFGAESAATATTLEINGDGGARFVGFYTDDPLLESLEWVRVQQTTFDSDGFAVGEFGISVVPETPIPSTYLAGLLLLGVFGFEGWRTRNNQK